MWSVGVIIYTLLGGYPPFHDENQTRLFRRIKAGSFKFHDEYWSNTSEQAKVKALMYFWEAPILRGTSNFNHVALLDTYGCFASLSFLCFNERPFYLTSPSSACLVLMLS